MTPLFFLNPLTVLQFRGRMPLPQEAILFLWDSFYPVCSFPFGALDTTMRRDAYTIFK